MASAKKNLRLVRGEGKPSRSRDPKLAIHRPLIRVVPASELTPNTLQARAYVHRTHHEQATIESYEKEKIDAHEKQKGRSRIYPEINVLNSAKGWYRSMIRLARSEGYTDMKTFFKESLAVNAHDKRLFDAVGAFIEWENKHGPR